MISHEFSRAESGFRGLCRGTPRLNSFPQIDDISINVDLIPRLRPRATKGDWREHLPKKIRLYINLRIAILQAMSFIHGTQVNAIVLHVFDEVMTK